MKMHRPQFEAVYAITLFCRNLDTSEVFYKTFLESEVVYRTDTSRVFRIGDLLINLLVENSVPELIEPEHWGKIGQNDVFTVHVPDLDSEAKRLIAKDIDFLNGPQERPWGIKALMIQDPDGHIWEIAEVLG